MWERSIAAKCKQDIRSQLRAARVFQQQRMHSPDPRSSFNTRACAMGF